MRSNPVAKVSRRRLAETTARLLREQPQKQSHILRMLAAYLVEHKQQKQVDLLVLDIAQELARVDGHLYAELSTAYPLSDAARKELTQYLSAATDAKTVELSESVDSELLAGVIVRTADLELDTSARSKLRRFRSLNVNARDIGE